jgi:hypothetical protein
VRGRSVCCGDLGIGTDLNAMGSGAAWSIKNRLKCFAAMALVLLCDPANACTETDLGSCFERPDGKLVFIEPAFEDYLFMFFDVCDAMEIKDCSYPVLMGDLGFNAMAARIDGVGNVIIYDRKLSALVGGDGAEAIIAHELAHIKCGHLEVAPDMAASHLAELEADRFAGAAMRRLGRPRETLAPLVDVLAEQPTVSHPGRPARVEALLGGYDAPETAKRCVGWKDEKPS